MKQTVSQNDFTEAFKQANREDNFSYDGLCALFNYFEEYEGDCDQEIELDVIAICCEFTEYEGFEEIQEAYPNIDSLEELQMNTSVIEFTDGIIIQDF